MASPCHFVLYCRYCKVAVPLYALVSWRCVVNCKSFDPTRLAGDLPALSGVEISPRLEIPPLNDQGENTGIECLFILRHAFYLVRPVAL